MEITPEQKKLIWNHLLTFAPIDELRANIDAVRYGKMTLRDAAIEYILGGGAAVYLTEVDEFLTTAGISHNEENEWQIYQNILADEIVGGVKC